MIPSVTLLAVVGGGMSAAAAAQLVRHPYAPEVSFCAGVGLMTWIGVQVVMIAPNGGISWLQPACFLAGAVVAALGWRQKGTWSKRIGEQRPSTTATRRIS